MCTMTLTLSQEPTTVTEGSHNVFFFLCECVCVNAAIVEGFLFALAHKEFSNINFRRNICVRRMRRMRLY